MSEEYLTAAELLWRAAKGSRHEQAQRKFEQRRWSEEPSYREKRHKRASRTRPRHLDMHPWFHLSPNENRVLENLLRGRSLAADYDDRKPFEHRISALATSAAFRCLGVERFMVLDIERHDGLRVLLLVSDITIRDLARVAWRLEGFSLRKDGSIGSKPTGISFTRARIMRRRLDGNWQLLRPRNKPKFRAHAHTPR